MPSQAKVCNHIDVNWAARTYVSAKTLVLLNTGPRRLRQREYTHTTSANVQEKTTLMPKENKPLNRQDIVSLCCLTILWFLVGLVGVGLLFITVLALAGCQTWDGVSECIDGIKTFMR